MITVDFKMLLKEVVNIGDIPIKFEGRSLVLVTTNKKHRPEKPIDHFDC